MALHLDGTVGMIEHYRHVHYGPLNGHLLVKRLPILVWMCVIKVGRSDWELLYRSFVESMLTACVFSSKFKQLACRSSYVVSNYSRLPSIPPVEASTASSRCFRDQDGWI